MDLRRLYNSCRDSFCSLLCLYVYVYLLNITSIRIFLVFSKLEHRLHLVRTLHSQQRKKSYEVTAITATDYITESARLASTTRGLRGAKSAFQWVKLNEPDRRDWVIDPEVETKSRLERSQ